MDRVRARESPQGTHVSQITLQFLVGEWLCMPFGLAENSGATLFVQSHDVKLMVGIPPIGSMRNSSKNNSILNRTKSGSFYRPPSFSEHGCAFSRASRGFSDQVEVWLDQSLDGRCDTRHVRQTLPHRSALPFAAPHHQQRQAGWR